MHDCLKIPELVDQIFSNFTAEYYGGDAKVLARLGRTCRLFHDPAMDVLWREPQKFAQHLAIGPTWRKRSVRLLRPIVPGDWDRALVYTRRVKSFAFPSLSEVSLSEIFPALSQCLPLGCVFPNLTHLSWYPRREADFPYIQLFISPTITSISISSMPASCTVLLPTLPLECRVLKKISIDLIGHAFRDMGGCFPAFLHQLETVEHLSMLLPDAASLVHVGRIETLRFLYLPALPLHVLPRSVEPASLFLNLSTLIVGSVDIEPATNIMAMCIDSTFQSLRFTLETCPTAEVMDKFYTALTRCRRSHASLRSLGVCSVADDEPALVQDPRYLLRRHTIQRLFCFAQLTEIEIESACGFELDDGICNQMARAWPHAERLTLKEFYNPVKQSVTLESLHSFAQHCPALNRLHLTFDARVFPGPHSSAQTAAGISQLKLEQLHVGYSLINAYNPRPVAKFIGDLFPNLQYLATARNDSYRDPDSYESDDDMPDYHSWQEVEERLPGRIRMWGR
ncbi:hypothetical protein MVEN_00692400 [Mycena venus]|uniref:F-box domain-containing protein n=1 Tax=Mycena venus TaxID=2733690 RepID=A0A8H7D5I2_9AGAR|nr:hypothetical protein MVEN_00692400 [Mycena venus]